MVSRALVGLCTLPLLASCSLLLDFDALQKGTGGRGGSGGTSNGGESGAPEGATGGNPGPAGAAGGGACPAECFHDDPCLVDGCNSDGSCVTGQVLGLALDGVDTTIPADNQYRVTMVGGDDAFYLSSFAQTGGKSEVTFYRLDGTANDLTTLGTLGGLAISGTGDPLSAAGLAFEPVVGIIHGFVALQDRVGTAARVWHVAFGPQDNLPKPVAVSSVTDGYYTPSPFSYPAAIYTGSQTYAAWLNADQSVSLSDGTNLPQRLAAGVTATTVSLLATDDNAPNVLYTVGGGGVFVESPSVAPYQVPECQAAAGDYLSSSAAFSTIPGLWVTGWTKYGTGYLTTESRVVACSAEGCLSDMDPCPDNAANDAVRNTATVVAQRPGDATSLMEVVQAVPFLGANAGQAYAALILTQQTVDLGSKPLQSKPVTTDIAPAIPLASQPTTPDAYPGPDWPAVAFVPPDRLAVAWTEPSTSASGDELRIQRYRMCLPP
jgi:hypothetical protein